jgi:hypothetical protein
VKGIGLAGSHDTATLLRSADRTAVAGPGTAAATSAGAYSSDSSSNRSESCSSDGISSSISNCSGGKCECDVCASMLKC